MGCLYVSSFGMKEILESKDMKQATGEEVMTKQGDNSIHT